MLTKRKARPRRRGRLRLELLEARRLLTTNLGAVDNSAGLLGWNLDNETLGSNNTAAEISFSYGFSSTGTAPGSNGDDFALTGDLDNIGYDQAMAVRGVGGALQWLGDTDRDTDEEYQFRFGLDSFKPLMADLNGDGYDDIVAVDFGSGTAPTNLIKWYVHYWDPSGSPAQQGGGTTDYFSDATVAVDAQFSFGFNSSELTVSADDIPILGDFSGDGRADVAVARDDGTNFDFYIGYAAGGATPYPNDLNTTLSVSQTFNNFGLSGDIPVAGDWDNDGDDNVGVVREGAGSGSRWYLDTNFAGTEEITSDFGNVGDQYIVGNWATKYWDGAGNTSGDGVNWNDANNWSGNSLPTATDTVVILQPDSVSPVTSTDAVSIDRFTSRESITIAGGSFAASNDSSAPEFIVDGGDFTLDHVLTSNDFQLSSGKLLVTNSALITDGTIDVSGGTIESTGGSAVTFGSAFDVVSGESLTVDGSLDLNLTGLIFGAGGFIKNGAGRTQFTANNFYAGNTLINAGELLLNNSGRLGNTSGFTVVQGIATLSIGQNISSPEQTFLEGVNPQIRAVHTSGVVSQTGTLIVNATSQNQISSTGEFLIAGQIVRVSGSGELSLSGAGSIEFASGNPSIYAGSTIVDGVELRASGADSIPDVSRVELQNGGSLVLDGSDETIGSLIGPSGTTVSLGANSLTIGADDTDATAGFAGVISGSGNLTKVGAGTLTLNGSNTFTGSATISGGMLTGSGSLAGPLTVASTGSIAPGNSPGIFNSGDFNLQSSSTLEIEIGGTTPGNTASNHDQVNVTGAVTLAGALDIFQFNSFAPAQSNEIVIINNDDADPVVGTFDALPEGSTVIDDAGNAYTISYSGGTDNNDVVLTALGLTYYSVTNANDNGVGSLRQAMLDANAEAGAAVIEFSGMPAGIQTITPTTPLPLLTDAVTIDATTKSDYTSAPRVQIVGTDAGVNSNAFFFLTGSEQSALQGFSILDFGNYAVRVQADDTRVTNNWIGVTAADGNVGQGNSSAGLYIDNADDVIVDSNVMADNTSAEIWIAGTSSNTLVTGNFIGTNAAGNGLLTTTTNTPGTGVFVQGIFGGTAPSNVRIGTDGDGNNDAAEANVVAGGSRGIQIQFSGGHTIAGNFIGTDTSGTIDLGHNSDGVYLVAAHNTTVGGDMVSERNIIAGNGGYGINQDAGFGNTIENNYIGTTASGSTALANIAGGVSINNASPVVRNNVISGNSDHGIAISGNGNGIDQSGILWLKGENDFIDTLAQNDGSNVGGVSFSPGVGGGQAFSLNGSNQYVQVADDDSLDVTTALSVDAWINPTALSGGSSAFYTIATKYDSQANAISWGLWAKAGGKLDFRVSLDGTTANTRVVESTNAVLSLNQFQHVAATFDTATQEARIYVDGIEVSTSVIQDINVSSIANTTTPIRIGAFRNTSGVILGHFNGLIDELAVYDTVLSESKIATIHAMNGAVKQGAVLQGNIIGLDSTGSADLGNAGNGIYVNNSPVNIIGGDNANERNIISGNNSSGIHFTGSVSTRNLVSGNYIGTNLNGVAAMANSGIGVVLESGAHTNTIGGSAAGQGNVISGNSSHGIDITDSGTTENVVVGNFVGTNATGSAAIPNGPQGIAIRSGATNNRIGTDGDGVSDAGERNVISGNQTNGIWLTGTGTSGNVIAGNYLGTDVTGNADLGNGHSGIWMSAGPSGNIIGTDGSNDAFNANERNVISGNNHSGIYLVNSGTDSNVIAGNIIGLNASGNAALGNNHSGVVFIHGASNNRLGTNGDGIGDAEERNIISANLQSGIRIEGSATSDNRVAGNYIGTDITGSLDRGNAHRGIWIRGGASDSLIGTNADGQSDELERNVISGNLRGIEVSQTGTTGTRISGNYIGTTFDGESPLGNLQYGVFMYGGSSQTIVGTNGDGVGDALEGNVISANTLYGVLASTNVSDGTIAGNFIGTNKDGTIAIGNGIGVQLENSSSYVIGTNGDGTSDTLERNIISGNNDHGVRLTGSGTSGNRVAGNFIGLDVTGNTALGNTGIGLVIQAGASDNIIGTDSTGDAFDFNEGNVISGNTSYTGIVLNNDGTDRNIFAGNIIGLNAAGDTSIQNNGHGIAIQSGPDFTRIGTDGDGVSDEAERNVVSGNRYSNVMVEGANTFGTIIAGNYVGPDATGSFKFSSGGGVEVRYGAQSTRVGTDGSNDGFNQNERNVISGANGAGVIVKTPNWDGTLPAGGVKTDNTFVAGNFIGVAASGVSAVGNTWRGISIEGAHRTIIGTNADGIRDAEERNIISGNGNDGIASIGSTQTTVAGNYIGVDVTGTLGLGNTGNGIRLSGGTTNMRVGTDGDGINDSAERNIVAGNAIGNPINANINITGAGDDNNIVAGNYVGTTADGLTALVNPGRGIRVNLGIGNRIGTDGSNDAFNENERNVVAGHARHGIAVFNSSGNVVAGNYVGLAADGSTLLGNGELGIVFGNTGTSRIGTNADGIGDIEERNVVVGSGWDGVSISGDNNVVAGNFIGTDTSGTIPLGNVGHGLLISDAASNLIGGATSIQTSMLGNVISGNGGSGVVISNADNNMIVGNFIGTDVTGTLDLGNANNGVMIDGGSQFNVIGTNGDGLNDAAERNVISGNTTSYAEANVNIISAHNNTVAGNYIGTNALGTAALSTTGRGVRVASGATSNIIGTDGSNDAFNANERNIISGHNDHAVFVVGGSDDNVVAGNWIGLDATGTVELGNAVDGISLDGVTGTQVGTNADGVADAAEANVVAGSGRFGILVANAATNNTLAGNFVGTNAAGTAAFGNAEGGIAIIENAPSNVVGGTSLAARNLVSGNDGPGIAVYRQFASVTYNPSPNNVIQGNYVGTNATGAAGLPNSGPGVRIEEPGTLVGGNVAGAGNLISGNTDAGILITGTSANGVIVQGNTIGTNAAGNAALSNAASGVVVRDGATNTQIGGWNTGLRNVISGNIGDGIWVADSQTDGTRIEGNFIGTDKTGKTAIANLSTGVTVSGASNTRIGGGWNSSTTTFLTGPGNVISGNAVFGVSLIGALGDTRVQGNRIGTNVSASAAIANGTRELNTLEGGVRISRGSGDAVTFGIFDDGVFDRTEGNIVSGNAGVGLRIDSGSGGHRISGNLIGVGVSGTQPLGNRSGIEVLSPGNIIGTDLDSTSDELEGNVIASSTIAAGISISDPALSDGVFVNGNIVRGNFIGTDRTATSNLGNASSGIHLQEVGSTIVGGVSSLASNVIAYNATAGIRAFGTAEDGTTVEASSQIHGNRYFENGTLSIDLGGASASSTPAVTLNDASDGIEDFPVIETATIDAGQLTIAGWVGAGQDFDLFVTTPESGSYAAWGEGRTRIASFTEGSVEDLDGNTSLYGPDVNGLTVSTAAINENRFEFTIPVPVGVNLGSLLTAVSVGPASEFSPAVFVGEQQSQLAPEINAGANETLTPGERLQRTGSFFDPDSTSWSGTVDYGDGPVRTLSIASDNSFILDHVYADAGSYMVMVTVTDASFTTGTAQFVVTVANEAPSLTVGNLSITSPITEGQEVTLSGSFGDSGSSDTHTIDIDWGDGQVDTNVPLTPGAREFSATHTYDNETPANSTENAGSTGIYRVSVTLRDQSGASDATPDGLLLVEVQNALPTDFVPTFSSTSVVEGGNLVLGGSFVDSGILDTHTVRVDWGDSSPITILNLGAGASSFSGLSHPYIDDPAEGPDQYTLRIEVVDDDAPFEPLVFEQIVQVANDIPGNLQLELTPTEIDESGQITLSGTFADAGSNDRHTLRVSWGDGIQQSIDIPAGSRTLPPLTHVYTNDQAGGFTITAEVTDRDSPSQSNPATATASVRNVKPILTGLVLGSTLLNEGETLVVTGSFSDLGVLDTHQVFIEWGDGTSSEAQVDATNQTFTAEHFYRDNGTGLNFAAPITVTVFDSDGAQDSQTQTITVNNVNPELDIAPLTAILNQDGTPNTDLIPLSAFVNDPGLDDEFFYEWLAEPLAPNAIAQTGTQENFTIDRSSFPSAAWRVTLTVQDDDMLPLNLFSTFSTVLLPGTNGPDELIVDNTTFANANTTNILALGLGGQDVIDATNVTDPNLRVVLDGGSEQDFLYGGAGNDTYYLRAGNDYANVAGSGTGGGGPQTVELTLEDGTTVSVNIPAGAPEQVVTAGDDRYVLTPNSTLTVVDPDGANELDFSLADFGDASGITFDLDRAISSSLTLQDVSSAQPNQHFIVTQGSFAGLVGSRFGDSLTAASNTKVSGGAGADTFAIKAGTVNASFSGGADDDILHVTETGIQDLNFTGDEGIDSLLNTGSIDGLVFNGGADDDLLENTGIVLGELIFGGGADQDVLINSGSILDLDFRGGADDDVLENRGTITTELTFGGDEGIDVLTNTGTIALLNFRGGADDDIFVNAGNQIITLDFRGGADEDILLDQAGTIGRLVFSGDDGADVFTNLGTISELVFGGGADDDLFINAGTETTELNFGGDEDVLLSGNGLITSLEFAGDDGVDSLFNTGRIDTLVFTGGADDDIFVNNGPTATQLGFGPGADDDVLLSGAGVVGTIDFRGGADGDDILVNLGSVTNIIFTGGADDDILLNVGTKTASLSFGGDEDILLSGNAEVLGTLTFSGDEGADTLINTGTIKNLNFNGGADDDFLLNEGIVETNLVFSGDVGLDILQNAGVVSGELNFQGDEGLDVLANEGQVAKLIFSGGADDDVFVNAGEEPLGLNFGGDDDILLNSAGSVSELVFGGDDGADSLLNLGTIGDLLFNGGADDDVLQNDGTIAIELEFGGDAGADTLVNNGSVELLVFGGGADDDVLVNRGEVATNLVFGGDQSLSNNGLVDVAADEGVDQLLNLGRVAGQLVFSGGADDDVLQNDGVVVGEITFSGDQGIDILRNSGSALSLNFNGGSDDDALINTGAVAQIIFAGEDGVDTLINVADHIGQITFGGGSDDDVLRNAGSEIGRLEFGGGADDDTLLNVGDSIGVLIFDGGADDDVLVNEGDAIGQLIFGGDLQTDGSITAVANLGNDTLIVRGSGKLTGSRLYFHGDAGVDALQNNAPGFSEITFVGGADDDALQNNAASATNITFSGDDGHDVFENNAEGVTTIVFSGGADDDLFINDGASVNDLTFNGGADDDVFVNNGSQAHNLVFSGDDGADVFVNAGGNVTGLNFNGGADDDLLINAGEALSDLVFNGDEGADTLLIREAGIGSSNLVFHGGADDDLLINDAAEIRGLTFVGDDGADGLQNNGFQTESLTFQGGADDDVFISTGSELIGLTFTGGADDDILQVSGTGIQDLNFQGDDGADVFLTTGQIENLTFNGGADDDVLQIATGTVTSLVFSGDDGADTLVSNGDVATLEFNGGADDDVLQNNGNVSLSLTFHGGADDDILISNGEQIEELIFNGDEGADTLINNAESVQRLVFNGDIGADVLRVQAGTIENLEFNGGADSDALKYSGQSSTARISFNGQDGNDLFSWAGSALAFTFDGGAGDDIGFVLGEGDLSFDGGTGDDIVKIIGNPKADLTLAESFVGTADTSSDTLDFASFTGGAITLDLRSNLQQPQSSSFSVTVLDGNAVENVIGTAGADTIDGNARNNLLFGADFAEPFAGPIVPLRSDAQWVYLDFDSQTNLGTQADGTKDIGEFVYSQDARDEIEARIEAVYRGPDDTNPWFDVRTVQQLADIPQAIRDAGQFATIFFNETPDFGRPGGLASEIDLGNQSLGGSAQVQVNGLLGGKLTAKDLVDEGIGARVGTADGQGEPGQGHNHGNMIGDSFKGEFYAISDAEVGSNKPAATSENFVLLSAKVAAHELGHLLGLRHADSFGPIGFGLHAPPGGSGYKPAYTGPSGAFETFDHILGSPASIGSTRFDDLQDLFFGEREAVKLTYSFSDPSLTTIADAGTNISDNTALSLPLVTAAVPNTLSRGVNSEKEFFVQLLGVNGEINIDAATDKSTNDWYSFEGVAGELINIDVMSNSLARFGSAPDSYVDTILNVWYEVDGRLELVPYYSGVATNDDIFEPTDSSIVDLVLPTDGTYFIEVDTFSRSPQDASYQSAIDIRDELIARRDDSDPSNDLSDAENNALERLIDTLEDQDVGQYQLFVFKYRDANSEDGIDSIKGNGGVDAIIGGPGDSFELTVDIGGDIGIEEGQGIDREVTLVDRGARDWSLSTVDYGDGTGEQPLAVDASGHFELTHQYTDDGEFTVTVTIRNDIGTVEPQSFKVFVENVAPTVTAASANVTVEEGQIASTNGTFEDVGDDAVTVAADFGNLDFDQSTGLWNWSYASSDDLKRKITITATDEDGAATPVSFDLTVMNDFPEFEAGVDQTLPTGSGVFTRPGIGFTDNGWLDTHEFTVNYGDGSGDQTFLLAAGDRDFDLNHVYSGSGVFPVSVTVTDDDGDFITDVFNVTVNLEIFYDFTAASYVAIEGDAPNNSQVVLVTRSGATSIASSVDVVLANDTAIAGSDFVAGPVSLSFAANELTKAVPIEVLGDSVVEEDESLGLTFSNFSIGGIVGSENPVASLTIENDDAAPEVDTGGPYIIDEGSSLTLDATDSSDADDGFEALAFRWDVDGDGDFDENVTGPNPTLTLNDLALLGLDDDATNSLTLEVTDGANTSTRSTTLTVRNVTPEITGLLTSNDESNKAVVGQLVSVEGLFTDAGVLDTHTVIVDWDDGTTSNSNSHPGDFTSLDVDGGGLGSFRANHVFSTGGIFDVKVTVIDDDAGASETLKVKVWVTGVRLTNFGELQIVGTPGKDKIDIKLHGGSDQVRVKARFDEQDNESFYFSRADVESIQIVLDDGDDDAKIGGSDGGLDIPAIIRGDAGDDKLKGGPGDDQLIGGDGDDDLDGGDGNDILLGGKGEDELSGGDGDDFLYGGADDDELKGGKGDDLLSGNEGDDELKGEDGDDVLIGGAGDDELKGGKGNDALSGNEGEDELKGEDGDDVLIGGAGADELKGGKGDDLLIANIWAHEDTLAAVNAIHQEWTRNDVNYETKRDHLSGTSPGGLNGSYVLNTSTLTDDEEEDELKGEKGRDLFFAWPSDDVKDKKNDEDTFDN